MHDYLNLFVSACFCLCVWWWWYTRYQDKDTECLSDLRQPSICLGKRVLTRLNGWIATAQRCKKIFKLNSFSTNYTIQSSKQFNICSLNTPGKKVTEQNRGKVAIGKKWMMGAAQRSTPPPELMEICQDPITILSTAYNVWMTSQNKDNNNAPQFHSVMKVKAVRLVVMQRIIWLLRSPLSKLCAEFDEIFFP